MTARIALVLLLCVLIGCGQERAQVREGIGEQAVILEIEKDIGRLDFDNDSERAEFTTHVFASAYIESHISHFDDSGAVRQNKANTDGSIDWGAMQINDASHPDCFWRDGEVFPGICYRTPECQSAPQPKALDLRCNVAAGVYAHKLVYEQAKVAREVFEKYCGRDMTAFQVAMKLYNGGPNSFNTRGCEYAEKVSEAIPLIIANR